MYGGDIGEEQLKQYKEKLADHKETVSELNNLTTQMITVFVNDAPAGYALLKQSAAPEELKGQKTLRLDSFTFFLNTMERTYGIPYGKNA